MSRSCCRPTLKTLSAALATLGLAACASAPTQFYTLLPPAPVASASAAQDPAFQIMVGPVAVPAQVDVPTLVVRGADGALTPVQTRRWIAPLDAEIRGALIAALTQRLGVAEVSAIAADPRLPTYRVQLGVQRFESALGEAALVDAAWTVRASSDTRRSATCSSRIRVPVAAGYEALARGHQQAVEQLAAEIGRALLAVQAGRAASACVDAAAP